MWLIMGFAAMGFLVGNLVGLTSEKVVMPVIGLFFGFVGTSILAVLHKLTTDDRNLAGKAILSLSACCLAGVYLSILVTEHRVLTPAPVRASSATGPEMAPKESRSAADSGSKYLRSLEDIKRANVIDSQLARKELTLEQAYNQMYDLARLGLGSPPGGPK